MTLSTGPLCHGKSLHASPGVPFSAAEKNHPRSFWWKARGTDGAPYRPHHSAPRGEAAQTRWLLAHSAAPLHHRFPQNWHYNAPLTQSRAILPAAPIQGKLRTSPLDLGIVSWLWPAEIQTRQQLEWHFQDKIPKHKFNKRIQNSMTIICRSSEEKRLLTSVCETLQWKEYIY